MRDKPKWRKCPNIEIFSGCQMALMAVAQCVVTWSVYRIFGGPQSASELNMYTKDGYNLS
jgi:hypothetical protein